MTLARLLRPVYLIAGVLLGATLFAAPGDITQDAHGVTLETASGLTRVEIWGDRIARVQHTPTLTLPSISSLAVIASATGTWQFQNNGTYFLLTTPSLTVRMETATGQVRFYDASSTQILAESVSGTTLTATTVGSPAVASYIVKQAFDLASGEAIYGLGQQQSGVMNWVGQSVVLQQKNMYVGVPVLLSNKGYSVLWDNPAVTTVDAGKTTAGKLSWSSEAGDAVNYYFCNGPEPDTAIAGYRTLTGTAPMFGKWAWGFWQSKERYQSQQEILNVAAQYRSLGIPIDGVVQDWRYWPDLDSNNPATTGWGSHLFDPTRYPDPVGMMDTLHAENVHLIISVWAKFDVTSAATGSVSIPNLQELEAVNGVFNPAIPYVYPAGQGKWLDPFQPAARQKYWSQLSQKIFAKGVDGWWLDASEAELSGNWGEFRTFNTALGPGAKVYNAYPLMETTGVYQGQRAETSAKRAFILTRSAYAGQQRNAAVTWSGDINGTWAVFANQIPAGLNFVASGIPYWNTDIGGFGSGNPTTAAYAELFTRWLQYGTFTPMFRVHGTNYAKEVWRFPTATQPILTNYINLRYRLIPYIYSQAWKVTNEGYTMMRPLVMDFRADTQVNGIGNQFMFGPSLLVNPVTTSGATSRNVYLPAGTGWFDFWTGASYTGGQTISAAAPIETMPLYVRAGAILPYGPPIQYAMERVDPTELRIYPGANGSFTLYEDEGDTYNYESGTHATIPFTWDDTAKTLTIGTRVGSFPGMLAQRTFRLVFVTPQHGVGLAVNTPADVVVTYNGTAQTITQPAVPAPPSAPTGVAAASTTGPITLSWTAPSPNLVYRVQRATKSGGPYTTVASDLITTSYVDSTVIPGTTYYYVIIAANAGGEGPASAEASTTSAGSSLQTLLSFNETSGTSAADSTVNGRHGTLVNGPLHVAGKGGNAVDLDGVDDCVSLPTGVVSALNNFTIATWVNLDAASTWSRIFDFGSGITNYMFLTPSTGSGGTVRFAITTTGTAGERKISGTAALPTGVWTHVAVTVSGNLGILYVNGVEVGRNSAMTLTPMSLGATTQNWIGHSQFSDPYLNGRVDDFRIYSNALAASEVLALFNGTAGALSSPWASQDIGTLGLPGSSGSPGNNIYLTASGSDIQGTSDNFHYVWRSWTGDGTLTARVNGVAATDPWTKVGLMFRETLSANARNAFVALTPGNGTTFQSRSSAGGNTGFSNLVGLSTPYWLKLQRVGNLFTPSQSADGVTWTQAGTPVTLSMATTFYVGFAATAHNNTLLTSAQFDQISLVASPPATPTGLTATGGNAQVTLNWNAASGATSYTVKRSTYSGGFYTTIASGTASTSYTDTGLTNGSIYYYMVSAVNTAGESAASSEMSALPLSPYQQWKLSNGLSLSLADTAAPDGDSIPVLLKYATGLTPGTSSATAPAVLSTVNNTLTLQFTRLSPAPVDYAVQSSTELSTWTTIAALPTASDMWTGTASVAETGTGATRETTVTDTQTMSSGPRRFLRLRVNTDAATP